MKYPGLRAIFDRLQQLIDRLAQHSAEPQISQHRDWQGKLYYQVYDAMMTKPITFGSEMEIKWWLEQRHRNQY